MIPPVSSSRGQTEEVTLTVPRRLSPIRAMVLLVMRQDGAVDFCAPPDPPLVTKLLEAATKAVTQGRVQVGVQTPDAPRIWMPGT